MTKHAEQRIEIDLEDVAKEDHHIAEEFICCICQLIVVDPVACFYCDTLFCKECIRDWAKIKKECPNRCHYKEGKLNVSLLRVLSKIRVNCKICFKTVSYESLLGIHKLVCEGREINCLYCDLKIKMFKFKEHRDNECQYSFSVCSFCQFKIIKRDFDAHMQQCKSIIISCPYCKQSMKKIDSERHLLECGEFKESCCNCKEEYKRDELS